MHLLSKYSKFYYISFIKRKKKKKILDLVNLYLHKSSLKILYAFPEIIYK